MAVSLKPAAGRDGLQSFVRTLLEILWLVSKVNSNFNVIAYLISHMQFNIWYISSLLHFVVMKVECLYILKILFVIDHFRVPLIFSFKASRSAKFWKRIFITVKDFALRFEIEAEVNSEILFCPLQAPFETPYVVRLHNVAVISPPQPCFVFVHPNRGL